MSSNSEDSQAVPAAKKPKFTVLDAEGWQQRWTVRQIGFHQDTVHPLLEKHVDKLLNKRENIDIFIPLCGKSLDIKWLSDKGHTVVGVECSSIALEEFFEEQNVEYTKEPIEQMEGSLYKSKDGQIKLYCCDVYTFSKEVAGQFDAIWDRGSMVAINRSDREKYTDILKSLMRPECRLVLDTLDYDETKHAGPPHPVPEDAISELYGESCSVEKVDTVDGFKERHKSWGIDSLEERIYLIIKK